MYEKFIQSGFDLLPKYVGFIYGTKIFIERPGGANYNQKLFYNLHKWAHCLVKLTI